MMSAQEVEQMGEFTGKGVLVTGGALGIGRGIVEGFARIGANVAIADVNRAAAEAAATAVTALGGGRAIATVGDVSSAADAQRMVAETVAAFGRLDVLVNNAGIQPARWYLRIEDLPEEAWDTILGVNLKGVYLMSRFAIPEIRRQGGGAIVNMASVQGLQSMPGVPAYAASKGGVLSLTRNMALDYARDSIRVTAICPGTIDSEMVRTSARAEAAMFGVPEDEMIRRYGGTHPIGRIGTPEDIANAAIFLASEQASFITGEALNVDGGLMAVGAWAMGAGAAMLDEKPA
jgi:NAD(P)-dependent dehydrogenase (short-subunit alcohol dehydrogenase family)